jgi:exodeoxyribonuclease VII large subunit
MTQFNFQSILQPDDPLSVSGLTAHVKSLLEEDEVLQDVRVVGEIGTISRPTSGHLYFTLKDASSQIKCAMWRPQVQRLRYAPKQGDSVIARGRVGVYERDGAYQLYVESMTPQGAGDLYAEFERLKQKLSDEGLFDGERKRALSTFPRTLGVVTSSTAAAFQDILNVLRRRYPLVHVLLSPTLVQGSEAPAQIVRAIERLNARDDVDVILVARGGGSMEELWAFNDERVVRAIVASRIPVVSGVGHEIDFTLADFAADLRAPTPSAAAEMITPDIDELRQVVDGLSVALTDRVSVRITEARSRVNVLARALRLLSPASQVQQQRTRVINLRERLRTAHTHGLNLWRVHLAGLRSQLDALGPQATLNRGYAVVRKADGSVVRSINGVSTGDALRVRVSDGEFEAETR